MRCYGSPKQTARNSNVSRWSNADSCSPNAAAPETLPCPPPRERHWRRLIHPRWHRRWPFPRRFRAHDALRRSQAPAHRRPLDPARVRHAFPKATNSPSISHLSGHSIVLRSLYWSAVGPPLHPVSGCPAIFANSESDMSPELSSRAGGDIAQGWTRRASPPEKASGVQPKPTSIEAS